MKLLLEPEIRAEHKEEPGSCFGDSNDQVQGHLACTVLVLGLTMTPCARFAGDYPHHYCIIPCYLKQFHVVPNYTPTTSEHRCRSLCASDFKSNPQTLKVLHLHQLTTCAFQYHHPNSSSIKLYIVTMIK